MSYALNCIIAIIVGLLLSVSDCFALDTAKVLKPKVEMDKRELHKNEVIIRSLEITETEFGPFVIETTDVDMNPRRGLASIKDGKLINVGIVPHNKKWDESTIAIKVPVRQGLLSYRLLLVNQQDLFKFKDIKDINDLRKLTAGLQQNWSTTRTFRELEMNMITGHSFEGLFLMLKKQRFDYIPRAVYEIYDELNNRKALLDNIVVEPNLALYMPKPSYVYVSPKEPRLAKRIESGLTEMVKNGELKRIFNKYYAKDIAKANLAQRRLIHVYDANSQSPDNEIKIVD